MENVYFRRPYSLKQEESAFHQRDQGTGIIIGAEPFYYPGKNGEAVLMVHGYTSTPRDLRQLGREINRAGYTARGMLLPGHGTKPTDLDNATWQQWFSMILTEYNRLSRDNDTIHVIGFSMGGTLAMHLAANNNVDKLILLSPFFKIAYNIRHVIPEEWLVYSIGRLLRHLKKKHTGNCNDPQARMRHIAYYHYALSSINQALELVNIIKGEIDKIDNKVLMIHAKRDRTTSPSASRRIFEMIPSKDKRFVWLRNSNHIITHDYDKETVFREILNFLKER
jgi:carboxylesterase